MDEAVQATAEDEAIEEYKKTLKGKRAPSTVEAFRAAFRAGVLWARNNAEPSKPVEEPKVDG